MSDSGRGTGARILLGAAASFTIGVAGTPDHNRGPSLAASQMGPRLLRNVTKDRGNQITQGPELGTVSNALLVLRRCECRTRATVFRTSP